MAALTKSCFHKSLPAVGNLANLLPTGSVLIFQSIIPSFSNDGACTNSANKLLTISLIFLCTSACFFSSFTDSVVDSNGHVYYGIGTPNGLYILNEHDLEFGLMDVKKERYKMSFIDFVHAFMSVVVFLALAVETSDVRRCLFPEEDGIGSVMLIRYCPVIVGFLATLFFC